MASRKAARRPSASAPKRRRNAGRRTQQQKNPPGTPKAERAPGLRERKKARLRQQIVDTAIRLFRQKGYQNTRIDDIVGALEISQPTFFRYFPTKSALLMDMAFQGIASMTEQFRTELAQSDSTLERLRRLYLRLATATEADQPLWRAVVLSGSMDPVLSPKVRTSDEKMVGVLQDILAEGQKRGEVTQDVPLLHLAQVLDGLYKVLVWKWAADISGRHSFADRIGLALEIFLRGIEP